MPFWHAVTAIRVCDEENVKMMEFLLTVMALFLPGRFVIIQVFSGSDNAKIMEENQYYTLENLTKTMYRRQGCRLDYL